MRLEESERITGQHSPKGGSDLRLRHLGQMELSTHRHGYENMVCLSRMLFDCHAHIRLFVFFFFFWGHTGMPVIFKSDLDNLHSI